jgi:hypothetical protein
MRASGSRVCEALLHVFDGVDFVVQEIHLAAALELAQAGFADLAVGPLGDEGLDRQALLRRRGDHREVAQAFQRQAERARDRRRGQRQHVHRGAQRLQRFLLAHAEAVLLVDDDEAEALELHILLQQAVGADQDVDLALAQKLDGLVLFLRRLETRNLGDLDRHVGEAVAEVLVVLLGQQRGRAQYRHLLAVGHGDEGGAHGDLGLAEADVAADQAVHRLAGFHVLDHGIDGRLLVGRFLEAEAVGEGFQVVLLEDERVALAGRALGIQVQQFGGGVVHLLGGLLLGLFPLARAQRVQLDGFRVRAAVARDDLQLGHRHVELGAVGVFEVEEFGVAFAEVHVQQARGSGRCRGFHAPRDRRSAVRTGRAASLRGWRGGLRCGARADAL